MNPPKDNAAPHARLKERYDAWLAAIGDPVAAAIMSHAQTMKTVGDTLAFATVSTTASDDDATNDGLMDLNAAAKYLGYKPSGLRKVIRAGQIECAQLGRGRLRFRPEWLDNFIAANSAGQESTRRRAAARRKVDPLPSVAGFDRALLDPPKAA